MNANPKDDNIVVEVDEPMPLVPEEDMDSILLCHLESFGFYHSHASPTHWFLCFATSPHYELDVDFIQKSISSTESLLFASNELHIHPDEWAFEEAY